VGASSAGPPGSAPAGSGARRRGPGTLLVRWGRALRGSGGLRILAALAGGLALYASFAPSTQWWAAIAGTALLGLALAGTNWRSGYGLGFLFGLGFYLPLLTWSNTYVGDLPWIALATAEALLVGCTAALVAVVSRRLPVWPVFAAAAWVAGEALQARFPFGGFPWGKVAFSQPDGPLLPVAALLGSTGLTFVTVLAGFAVAALLRLGRDRRRGRSVRRGTVLVALGLVVLPFLLGVVGRAAEVDPAAYPSTVIAVIQGNVPEPGLEFNARRRAVTDMHVQETERLAAAVRAGTAPKPQLVIWPENASDIDPYRNADAAAEISAAARDIGVPILVGAVVESGQPGLSYNRGIVWDPVTGPGDYYDKQHPVPFGEYMPYRSFFRIFSDQVDLLRGAFLPGDRAGNLDVGGVAVGDVICFEVAYDNLVTDVVNGGAQVLVVQTNNATFGWSDETYQQQAMSRVRAVEHGREVLIAATSGVSAAIRPDGSVESSIPLFTAGYLTPQVPLITATTFGTVLGTPVEWGLTALAPVALLIAWVVVRRRRSFVTAPVGSPAEESTEK